MISFDKTILVFYSILFNSYFICSDSGDQTPGNSDNSNNPSNVAENLNRDIFDDFENDDNLGHLNHLNNFGNLGDFEEFNPLGQLDDLDNFSDFEELNHLGKPREFGDIHELGDLDNVSNPDNLVQTADGNLKVEIIGDQAFFLGEGPFWDERQSVLWHVDTFNGSVCRLDVKRRVTKKLNLKDYISIVIPIENRDNKFIVSRRNELTEFDWNSNSYKVITNVQFEKYNDGKVDAMGRLWIGTLRNTVWDSNDDTIRNAGALYRLDGRKLTRIVTMSLPNGMAWSLDNKNFYIVDTLERQIYVYDFHLIDGSIRNKRILLDFNNNTEFLPQELPDGMAVDKWGNLWLAVIFGGRVIQFDSKTGKIIRSIPTNMNQTSSVAFGGPDYKQLYVTTGYRYLTYEEQKIFPNTGKTLRITADFIQGPGPANRVRLP